MRKLKLQMRISVNGFVADLNGNEPWNLLPDDKLFQFIYDLPDGCDTLLLGRKFAENFIPHFEGFKTDDPKINFAQKMVDIPKIIFTKTLNKPFGKNTSLATGNLHDEITKLKRTPGKDMLVYGGAGFVSSLIAGGHIDEYHFLVVPIMINNGMRIFDLINTNQNLALISATTYNNGVVRLHYELNKAVI